MLGKAIRIFALIFAFTTTAFANGDYTIEFQPRALQIADRIENKGILKRKQNGYLNLEVSDHFIGKLLPLIQADGQLIPPHDYTSRWGIGAHISVMYEKEQFDNGIRNIDELGSEFSFNVLNIRTVNLDNKKLWVMAVEAPALERLSPKLGGHDFHITLCTEVPVEIAVAN